jgi:uridine kinase
MEPLVIGIAGGTGSGKSTVAGSIFSSLPEKNILVNYGGMVKNENY